MDSSRGDPKQAHPVVVRWARKLRGFAAPSLSGAVTFHLTILNFPNTVFPYTDFFEDVMEQPAVSEVRGRGEVTIPKKIREAFHFAPGQHLEFIPLGPDAVLLTVRRLELEEARRQIRRILSQTKVSSEKILKGLEASREEVYQKHYGRRKQAPKHVKGRQALSRF